MSYMYILTKYFWKDLYNGSYDNRDNSLEIKLRSHTINSNIQDAVKSLRDKPNGYYQILLKYLQTDCIDNDMLCDYLSYVPLYRESFYYQYPNSDVLEFVKTSTEDFSHSIEEVVKLIWSVDVLSFFKKIVRSHYLNDFMTREIDYQEAYKLVNELKKVSIYNCHNDVLASYNNLMDSYEELRQRRDFIASNYIDSVKTEDAIIEEQQYYMDELDRLISVIEKKGNTTNLNHLQFEAFLKFIYGFKECANKKIEVINETKLVKRFK